MPECGGQSEPMDINIEVVPIQQYQLLTHLVAKAERVEHASTKNDRVGCHGHGEVVNDLGNVVSFESPPHIADGNVLTALPRPRTQSGSTGEALGAVVVRGTDTREMITFETADIHVTHFSWLSRGDDGSVLHHTRPDTGADGEIRDGGKVVRDAPGGLGERGGVHVGIQKNGNVDVNRRH